MSRLRVLLTTLGVLCVMLASIAPAPMAHAAGTGDDYPSNLKSASKDALIDPWRFYNRECVSFVAWRLNQQGGTPTSPWSFSNFMRGPNGTSVQFGNAWEWLAAAQKGGWGYDHVPTVGSVAYWGRDTGSSGLGHVSIVEAVNPDGTVDVEEYNWSVRGGYGTRSGVRATWYLHIQDGEQAVPRLAGPERYSTSAAASADAFSPGVPVAYVATGSDFPDALSGGPAAAAQGGPMLLVKQSWVPAAVATELTRLKPGRIVVLGGPTSVSDDVVDALAAYTSGRVTRMAGGDRYATSAAASAAAFSPGAPVAYVATGDDFPDALSGGPAAAAKGGPVLLVKQDAVPSAVATELTRLKPGRIVVLGGAGSVSDDVRTGLRKYTSGSVTRVSGPERYSTSAATSAAAFPAGVPVAYVATGADFPDALSGGPAAGAQGGPVLLVKQTWVPSAVAAELTRLKPQRIVVLGGTGSVSDAVAVSLSSFVVD